MEAHTVGARTLVKRMFFRNGPPWFTSFFLWMGKVLGATSLVVGLLTGSLSLYGQLKNGDPNPINVVVDVVVESGFLDAETQDMLNRVLQDEMERRGLE